jgi:hypothetical protein
MARNIYELYLFFQDIVRKQIGVFITDLEFNRYINAGGLDCMQEWFKDFGITNNLHDALLPLRKRYQFLSDGGGIVIYPSDYNHILGAVFTVTGSTVNEVNFVQDTELIFALKSQQRPVSNSYPIAIDWSNEVGGDPTDVQSGFKIFPEQVQVGFFNYLKLPQPMQLVYTQVGRVITYDSVASVQPYIPDSFMNHVLARSLWYAGVSMSEQEVSNFAQQYSAETKP